MSRADFVAWGIVGVMAFVVLVRLVFSPNARLRRRLKKTHGRIISKSRLPAVRLSVKPPKK